MGSAKTWVRRHSLAGLLSPDLDDVWSPRAGEPVVVRMGKGLVS